MLKVLRAIKAGKAVPERDLDETLKKVGFDPYEMSKNILSNNIASGVKYLSYPGLKKTPIKATTIQSSKGLDADYVFITHFDDQYFIKNIDKKKITDRDICNFLVALTRARRGVFLISSSARKVPTFLKWIKEERIKKIP